MFKINKRKNCHFSLHHRLCKMSELSKSFVWTRAINQLRPGWYKTILQAYCSTMFPCGAKPQFTVSFLHYLIQRLLSFFSSRPKWEVNWLNCTGLDTHPPKYWFGSAWKVYGFQQEHTMLEKPELLQLTYGRVNSPEPKSDLLLEIGSASIEILLQCSAVLLTPLCFMLFPKPKQDRVHKGQIPNAGFCPPDALSRWRQLHSQGLKQGETSATLCPHNSLMKVYQAWMSNILLINVDVIFPQQLHSSVRTGNLETCLRLLSLGAQANFFDPVRDVISPPSSF